MRRFTLVQLCFQRIHHNLYQNPCLINEWLCVVHILRGRETYHHGEEGTDR